MTPCSSLETHTLCLCGGGEDPLFLSHSPSGTWGEYPVKVEDRTKGVPEKARINNFCWKSKGNDI